MSHKWWHFLYSISSCVLGWRIWFKADEIH